MKKPIGSNYSGCFKKSSLPILMLSLFISITACTTTSPHRGGLFINQDEFYPDPADQAVLLWERGPIKKGERPYTKILIDPLLLLFEPEGDPQVVEPDEMKAMADLFRAELVEKLGVAYGFVDRVGEDVLRVRIAITDLIPVPGTKGGLQDSQIPFAVDVSAAILEVEILDSESSKRLVALISKGGDTMVETISNNKEKKAQVERAFTKWAGDIRRGLDLAASP